MLSRLCIKNYVLVQDVTLSFSDGLNIISGETGAGKSIIISAIGFVLGARSDKNVVMSGSDFARVEAQFELLDSKTQDVLSGFGIDCEDGLVLSRKLNLDGKSEIRANGQIITLSMLKQITQNLLEIYGQHAYQILLDENKHIDFVDFCVTKELAKPLETLNNLLKRKSEILKTLDTLVSDETLREREKEMLEYQIKEIEDANLQPNEDVALAEKLNKMKNTQKVVEVLRNGLLVLRDNDENSVVCELHKLGHELFSITNIDKNIDETKQRIESTKIELEDVADTIEQILSQFDFDEEDFNTVDERLDCINKLKRKYGATVEEILNFCDDASKKLEMLSNSEATVARLKQDLKELEKQIDAVCCSITEIRKEASQKLSNKLVNELDTLGLKNTKFEVAFEKTSVSARGCDKLTFFFSANVGQKPMPLAKVISGGEMSRFMLAFDIIFGQNKFSTLIFDEIDTGISGEVSHIVANKMFQLSRHNQVIAITHLPAICAMADTNFKVQKHLQDGKTVTFVQKLDNEQNISEIARLTGVISNSQIAMQSAQELKAMCDLQKQKLAVHT